MENENTEQNSGQNTGSQEASFQDKVDGPRELPQVDVSKHVGTKVLIEAIDERRGQYGPFIVLRTAVVETIETSNEDVPNIELRGSRLFSLNEDKEGKIYWPVGGNLDSFLTKYGKTNPFDLVGVEVQLISVTNKKDGKDYLGFN